MSTEIKRAVASDIWAITGDSSIVNLDTFPVNDEAEFGRQAVSGVELVWETVHESVFSKVEGQQQIDAKALLCLELTRLWEVCLTAKNVNRYAQTILTSVRLFPKEFRRAFVLDGPSPKSPLGEGLHTFEILLFYACLNRFRGKMTAQLLVSILRRMYASLFPTARDLLTPVEDAFADNVVRAFGAASSPNLKETKKQIIALMRSLPNQRSIDTGRTVLTKAAESKFDSRILSPRTLSLFFTGYLGGALFGLSTQDAVVRVYLLCNFFASAAITPGRLVKTSWAEHMLEAMRTSQIIVEICYYGIPEMVVAKPTKIPDLVQAEPKTDEAPKISSPRIKPVPAVTEVKSSWGPATNRPGVGSIVSTPREPRGPPPEPTTARGNPPVPTAGATMSPRPILVVEAEPAVVVGAAEESVESVDVPTVATAEIVESISEPLSPQKKLPTKVGEELAPTAPIAKLLMTPSAAEKQSPKAAAENSPKSEKKKSKSPTVVSTGGKRSPQKPPSRSASTSPMASASKPVSRSQSKLVEPKAKSTGPESVDPAPKTTDVETPREEGEWETVPARVRSLSPASSEAPTTDQAKQLSVETERTAESPSILAHSGPAPVVAPAPALVAAPAVGSVVTRANDEPGAIAIAESTPTVPAPWKQVQPVVTEVEVVAPIAQPTALITEPTESTAPVTATVLVTQTPAPVTATVLVTQSPAPVTATVTESTGLVTTGEMTARPRVETVAGEDTAVSEPRGPVTQSEEPVVVEAHVTAPVEPRTVAAVSELASSRYDRNDWRVSATESTSSSSVKAAISTSATESSRGNSVNAPVSASATSSTSTNAPVSASDTQLSINAPVLDSATGIAAMPESLSNKYGRNDWRVSVGESSQHTVAPESSASEQSSFYARNDWRVSSSDSHAAGSELVPAAIGSGSGSGSVSQPTWDQTGSDNKYMRNDWRVTSFQPAVVSSASVASVSSGQPAVSAHVSSTSARSDLVPAVPESGLVEMMPRDSSSYSQPDFVSSPTSHSFTGTLGERNIFAGSLLAFSETYRQPAFDLGPGAPRTPSPKVSPSADRFPKMSHLVSEFFAPAGGLSTGQVPALFQSDLKLPPLVKLMGDVAPTTPPPMRSGLFDPLSPPSWQYLPEPARSPSCQSPQSPPKRTARDEPKWVEREEAKRAHPDSPSDRSGKRASARKKSPKKSPVAEDRRATHVAEDVRPRATHVAEDLRPVSPEPSRRDTGEGVISSARESGRESRRETTGSVDRTRELVLNSLMKSGMSPERSQQVAAQLVTNDLDTLKKPLSPSSWTTPRESLNQSMSKLETLVNRAEASVRDGAKLREIKAIMSEIRDLSGSR